MKTRILVLILAGLAQFARADLTTNCATELSTFWRTGVYQETSNTLAAVTVFHTATNQAAWYEAQTPNGPIRQTVLLYLIHNTNAPDFPAFAELDAELVAATSLDTNVVMQFVSDVGATVPVVAHGLTLGLSQNDMFAAGGPTSFRNRLWRPWFLKQLRGKPKAEAIEMVSQAIRDAATTFPSPTRNAWVVELRSQLALLQALP